MTLEQTRAAMAYGHLEKVTTKEDRTLYGSMAQKLPALIRSAGLCQAIYFVKSRKKPALDTLLGHLSEQLGRVDPKIHDLDSLCARARETPLANYVWLTREALASVSWYGRLARSEWNVLPGDGEKVG
jgi:CRISPR type III-B/RAMP module-associated protein Cmr5